MCKHCTLIPIVRLVALVLLAVGVAACLVGFVAPFWAYYDPGLPCELPPDPNATTVTTTSATGPLSAKTTTSVPGPSRAPEYEGLWGRCLANNFTLCTWFWDNNFQLETCFPVWHKAAQGLYLGGFVLLLLAILIACCHVCCGCCKYSAALPTILGLISIIGLLGVLASVLVYGIMSYKERDIYTHQTAADGGDTNLTTTAASAQTGVALIEWGYYVAAAGAGVSLLAGIIFCCDGRRSGAQEAQYEAAASMDV